MNKAELISSVADKAGISRKDSEKAVNAMVDTIILALRRNDKVQMIGFGSFEVKKRAARTGRNPKTGEEIPIPAAKLPVFKPGKALKDALEK